MFNDEWFLGPPHPEPHGSYSDEKTFKVSNEQRHEVTAKLISAFVFAT